MSDESVKDQLAAACRILAAHGLGDQIYGHMSARSTVDPGLFWMKPHTIGLEETTPERLILLDMDGTVLEGDLPRHREYPIHAEILRSRPDVGAVVHAHPLYGIVLGARGLTIRPVSHEGACFQPEGVPVFDDSTDLVVTAEQGAAVARVLGSAQATLLRNHGVVVVGATVAEACRAAIVLERAARIQLMVQPGPDSAFVESTLEDALRKKTGLFSKQAHEAVFAYLRRSLGT